jgi:hypothetical protein
MTTTHLLFVFTVKTHKLTNVMMMIMMMMIMSPSGQLGLWAPSSGVRDAFTSAAYED